ncbi:hypothetical protein BANRA_05486 [Klebsiella pneumoniae]|nr:hypothetical protein BANRA_05486 [Klebsiella pneumoniae]
MVPLCLTEDAEPTIGVAGAAIASTCPRHGLVLADSCHDCGAPAVPHRGADPWCHICTADRRDHPVMAAESQALQFEFRLSEMLAPDVVPRTDLEAIHPLAYFGWFVR